MKPELRLWDFIYCHPLRMGAIADSGTALSPWLVDINPSPSVANRVVEALGCSATSMRGKLTCLKAAPLQDILKIQERAKKQVFVPTIDIVAENSFIPFPPKSLYQKRYKKDVNYLIGFARHEAAFEVSREFPNVLKYQHLDKMIQHFLKPHFINAPNFEMIAIAAKYHYLRRIMIPSFESLEPHIERMMTDFLYKSPLEQVIKLHMQKVNNIFVYRFKANAQDACGLENRRCFGNEFYVFNMTSRENLQHLARVNIESIIETLSKIWGNFIEHGYPDVHRRWKPYKSTDDLQHYAEISDIVQPRVNHAIDDSEFWISLVSELNAASNVTEEHSVTEPTPEYSAFRTWGVAGLAVLFGVLCVALVGVVVITKGKTLHVSIIPVSSSKETAIRN